MSSNPLTTTYDPSTALIVVDVQNDFADPNGSLAVPDGEAVLPVINAQIAAATRAGALIICSQDWHPARTPHFQTDGGPWPSHCVAGTWGAELHPALRRIDSDPIRKGAGEQDGYSAFSLRETGGARLATDLERRLRDAGVHSVVVTGLATDYCVRETALDALRLGFGTAVLRAAVRAVDLTPGDGDRALAAMAAAGAQLR